MQEADQSVVTNRREVNPAKVSRTVRLYHADAEFREKHLAGAARRAKERRKTDPVYAEQFKLMVARCYRRRGSNKGLAGMPLEAIEARLAVLREIQKTKRAERLEFNKSNQHITGRKMGRPIGSKSKGPPTAEDLAKREYGLKMHQMNLAQQAEKQQASKELKDFMAQWRLKWAHLRKRKGKSAANHRRRRDQLVKQSRDPKDKAIFGQINNIMFGACSCYWCGKDLPRGGEVDHVVPLAKGGSHTSGNICAACPDCNSKKSCTSPSQFSEQPSLL